MPNDPCGAVQAHDAAQSESQVFKADPPAAIKELINQLFATGQGDVIRADQISPGSLLILNRFAASIAGSDDCEVVAIHDCHTCYVDDAKPGRWIATNGRMHCWQC